MAYNFPNPFQFPWGTGFAANGFNAGTSRPPPPAPPPQATPNFSPDVVYPGARYPGIFRYGMPYQGGDHNSHFGAEWNFPYTNNLNRFPAPLQQNSTSSGQIQTGNIGNFTREIHPQVLINIVQNGNTSSNVGVQNTNSQSLGNVPSAVNNPTSTQLKPAVVETPVNTPVNKECANEMLDKELVS